MTRETTIYLVRHAESRPSADVPEPDWPLSARGQEQARALALAMAGLEIDAIYSSPYRRARDTLAPLVEALGKPMTIVQALHERVLSRRYVGDEYWPTIERYWGDRDFALPDGESNRACAQRMALAIDELAARHPGDVIALASHGNALALYLGTIDPGFGYEQWRAMRNPDLFRVVYQDGRASWDGTRLPTCLLPDPVQRQTSSRMHGIAAPDVDALLSQMTLAEKIGQMTQVDRNALERESDIAEYFLGSLLNGGDSLPQPNQPAVWADTLDRYQGHALGTRLGIPLLYGADAVHGHNGVHGAVIFPHNIGLGATRNPEIVAQAARVTALEMAATGVDWTFAPCVAVPRDERWGRTYEGFGETPELAQSLGAAAVRGYQTARLAHEAAVLACAKHFVGDGGTEGGRDRGDTHAREQALRAIHLPPYAAAIEAGVGSIMVSYSSVDGVPMHGHRHLITDVLKGELGFPGFVVTDWEAIDKLSGDYTRDVETAINAGIDMVMVPARYKLFIATLHELVDAGCVPRARIDDAVRRILRQKAALGLWERPFAERALLAAVGSPEHRAVAREAVRQSLVLLKNERAALPIGKRARIHVGGSKADDIGIQCGGWTVSWMGKPGPITPGTTILEGLRQAVARPEQVSFAADGAGGEDAEVAVAVVGETPYAEWVGDRADLRLPAEDLALIAAMRRPGRRLVVVLVTGRPLVLAGALADADALIVAWLPGSEGGGVADVLLGDRAPTGKLPHSWPRANEDVPVNVGDAQYAPLFAYGFGLGY